MALIPYPPTQRVVLSTSPLDLRARLSDDRTPERGFLRFFVQAAGDGIEWADASTAPAAGGAWHRLPDEAGVILAIPEDGSQRPWFRATETGSAIIVSGANG